MSLKRLRLKLRKINVTRLIQKHRQKALTSKTIGINTETSEETTSEDGVKNAQKNENEALNEETESTVKELVTIVPIHETAILENSPNQQIVIDKLNSLARVIKHAEHLENNID
jgi:hypothetical protein